MGEITGIGWLRDLKADCDRFSVPLFVKQMSARTPAKGQELIPADLLIREFP